MYGYEQVHAEYYDYMSTGIEGDLQFYVEEAQKAGSPVLELGCGTGRVLIPTAEAGIHIVGLDLSRPMLAIARRKLAALDEDVKKRIELVEGDMRRFSLGQRFRLVTIPFGAFLHLMTADDQKAALSCIREHLDDDGKLILSIFDPRLEYIVAHLGALGPAFKKHADFIRADNGNRVVVSVSNKYDLEQQTLTEDRVYEEIGKDGRVVSKAYSAMTLRYVYRYEMQHLLELCGYRIEALYGDFARGPFRYGGQQIWVAGVA